MTSPHVFAETNLLFHVFRLPSKRHRDALALKARFEAGGIKLYLPYLCFQEARNLISNSLPSNRCSDLLEFHRFAATAGTATWDFAEVSKLLDAATGEVNQTRAVYQRELADFADAVGAGIMHGTRDVFDFLESLQPDHDLKYNDKLILSCALLKAGELHRAGVQELYFASLDKGDLQPRDNRPKMTAYYAEAGLTFVPGFVLPDTPATPA
jgi:predicted nucleic acid-binding protein